MLSQIIETDKQYYMNTFGARTPVCFDYGKGLELYTKDGDKYYDFFAGIAVTALGHSHPKFVKSITEQAGKLLHTSSIYYIEKQAQLAKLLVENSCADKAFFCSTGAEANEGAMKLAKIYFYKQGKPNKNEIITLKNSFHGRTLATVAATGQEKYQKPYKPLTPGFKHVEINDFDALAAAVNENTAAIMMEPVQGESGVHPAKAEYLKKVRQLCDEKEIILIFDEVQTGMGRTGKLFAYENYGVEPDIFTLAKALGNGIPIGAVCAKEFVASGFEPGDHGTTFGGNPFSCNAACTVFEIFKEEKIVENAAEVGAYFKEKLNALADKYDFITEVRGIGLMLGVETKDSIAKKICDALFENKYLTGCIAGKIIRILPPLVITKADVDKFIEVLAKACEEV
ncbi:MAG: aspartate aminotransferase family protein [Clostridia bacterium]|nr:aspartate aminotransferase family protein [Clostridia bacterium]